MKKFKAHSLTGRITYAIMEKAFKAVKRNRGAAGLDKVSIDMYQTNLEQNLLALMKRLKERTYKAAPLRRHYIPKSGGKFRKLGIPSVRDRVAQEVIRSIMEPVFEKIFHDNSYGFRKGKNAHQAIERVLELKSLGYKYVVDADIKGFFDNINHKIIENLVADEVADGNFIKTVKEFLNCGVIEDGKYIYTRKGTPQGGVISPLLANIVLNKFDWALEKAGYKFVRYADDFVILTKTQETAKRALDFAKENLAGMGLTLNTEKTKIAKFTNGFDFLGFTINHFGARMKTESIKRFCDKINKVTKRSHNLEAKTIKALNRIIVGTANYFIKDFTTGSMVFIKLSKRVRRRIRCMKYKRISKHDNHRLRIKHFDKMGLKDIFKIYQSVKC
jgi:group II intron reverse transcriptase/maturase